MNKIVVAFLLCNSISLSHACSDESVKPTAYIMQALVKSGTIWRGDIHWKDTLQNGNSVKTNFLAIKRTKPEQYCGALITFHNLCSLVGKVNVDTLKAHFHITYDKVTGTVNISSDIIDIQVASTDVSQDLKKPSGFDNINSISNDSFSKCIYTKTSEVGIISKPPIHTTLTSKCVSTMPYEVFMEAMKKEYTK